MLNQCIESKLAWRPHERYLGRLVSRLGNSYEAIVYRSAGDTKRVGTEEGWSWVIKFPRGVVLSSLRDSNFYFGQYTKTAPNDRYFKSAEAAKHHFESIYPRWRTLVSLARPDIDLMGDDMPLTEVHYTDIWPKGFSDMIKDWKKKAKSYDLYVNFSNVAGNTLDRSANQDPDHQDMVGTYGYPLEYVIKHPADVWYGHGMQYCRVIRDKSRLKLNLSHMTSYDLDRTLSRCNLNDDNLSLVRKHFKETTKGVTAPGKQFVVMLQRDFNAEPTKNDYGKPEWPVRTGRQQTDILRRGGYDCIEDSATRLTQAAINDREPQQICWLVPQAFEVLSVYRLSDLPARKSHVIQNTDHLIKKMVAQIAIVMGDKLEEREPHQDLWWTQAGRQISVEEVDTSLKRRMATLKMGQKEFKSFKHNTQHAFYATIKTERGDFRVSISDDEKLVDAIARFTGQWQRAEPNDAGPRFSRAAHLAAIQAEKNRYYEQERINKVAEVVKNWPKKMDLYNRCSSVMNLIPLPQDLSDEEKYLADSMMTYAVKRLKRPTMRLLGLTNCKRLVRPILLLRKVAEQHPPEYCGYSTVWESVFYQWLREFGPKEV